MASVTLSFPDENDDGIVDGTGVRVADLEMHSAGTAAGPWVKDLVFSVDETNNTVLGLTSHFSFFALFGPAAANDLQNVRVYPFPFVPNNGNSDDGRDHWPYCYTALIAGGGIKKGYIHGKSDKTASAPVDDAVHPAQLLATIYHAFGIDPQTIVFNHLNQPRELVKGEAVTELFA